MRDWTEIRIRYNDGTEESIFLTDIKRIENLEPIIEGLTRAKSLKDKLDQLLK